MCVSLKIWEPGGWGGGYCMSIVLWAHRNLFWQLSKDGNLRWKLAWFRHVTCHDSLSKTIRQGTWKVGDAMSAKEMLDGRQRADIPTHARTAHSGWKSSLLNHLSCHPDDKLVKRLN